MQDALARSMHGRTTVVVAHRLSTIRNAQSIAVVQARPRLSAQSVHAPHRGWQKLHCSCMRIGMQQAKHLQGVSGLISNCALWGSRETACILNGATARPRCYRLDSHPDYLPLLRTEADRPGDMVSSVWRSAEWQMPFHI